jgi:hypothetical protein
VGEERSLDVLGEGVKGQATIAPRMSRLNLNHFRREELKLGGGWNKTEDTIDKTLTNPFM